MPDPITALADRIDTVPLAVKRGLVGAIQTFKRFLLDYNRHYLDQQGQRPDGEPIQASGYSPGYAAYKRKYARYTNTDFVDLKFSGNFLDGFRLEYVGNLRFEIVNGDPKAARLLERYGGLYGVREEDVKDFIVTYLLPEVWQLMLAHIRA